MFRKLSSIGTKLPDLLLITSGRVSALSLIPGRRCNYVMCADTCPHSPSRRVFIEGKTHVAVKLLSIHVKQIYGVRFSNSFVVSI